MALARLAVLVSPSALLAGLGWTHRWNADDAFINFRVVDQLVHGNGPVYNFTERVEAYTSSLWIAVLAVPAWVLGIGNVEWIAVVLGLIFSVGGVLAATLGAAALNRDEAGGLMVPLGALVFVALPPAWDFATSGLETGLGFAWLGTTFLVLALVRTRPGWRDARLWRVGPLDGAAVLAGLGPLVRPDFALFSLAFLAMVVAASPRRAARAALRAVAFAAPLPLLYQLFRMGYFAELGPNTALAKEAGRSRWSFGLDYLWDTASTYVVLLPVAGLLGWLGWRVFADVRARDGRAIVLRLAPVAAGVLHLAYVARVGGDFMHARLVLPGLFSILLPVAALPVRRRVLDVALGTAVATWALVCALALAPPYKHSLTIPRGGIVDERSFYTLAAQSSHPVTLHDYRRFSWPEEGAVVKARAAARRPGLTWVGPNDDACCLPPELPVGKGVPVAVVAPAENVGLFGFAAGRRAWVVDRHGLGDPIAARLRLIARGRPGHEKTLPAAWTVARFTNVVVAVPNSNPAEVAAARLAMRCGDLGDTMGAITERMTPRRFVKNVALARRSSALRIDGAPIAAAQQLC